MKVSIVVPVLNEQSSIQPLYERVKSVFESLPEDFEVVYVDDGSTDATWTTVRALASADPRVRGLSLSRRFGHQAALTAGTDAALGEAVIHMDGDLQHPPELLRTMIERWREGYEIVYTLRESTQGIGFVKRLTQALFYRTFGWLSGLSLPPNAADFRLMDRRVVDALGRLRERNRFLRGLTRWVGFRSIGLPYAATARHAGISKYDGRQMLHLAVDALISFSDAPLLAAIYMGVAIVLLDLLYMAYVIYTRLVAHQAVTGWASLMMALLGIGGMQLVILGLVGLYIGKIHDEVKQRPIYLVRETIGSAPGESPELARR
jgi:polyisoprenyl-phosphate glycosyltransferase